MLHVDIPSCEEYGRLASVSADACVSIYLESSPLREELDRTKITFGNFITEAINEFTKRGLSKKRIEQLSDELYSVLEDPTFWNHHARSLAILATPDNISTYRLANNHANRMVVGERFYLKPLLRAITFPHSAYILALSENEARVVEFFADAPAEVINVPGLPGNKSEAMTEAAWNDTQRQRVAPRVRTAQYTRHIDNALRPLFAGNNAPLILAAAEPTASIFRSTNTISNLMDETLFTNPEKLTPSELATLARPMMESYHQSLLDSLKPRFEERAGQRRTTTDIATAAKAATFGAIDLLLVNHDHSVGGTIDERGLVTFSEAVEEYCVVDEIVKRAMMSGAKVMAVRSEDLPEGANLHAILRWVI